MTGNETNHRSALILAYVPEHLDNILSANDKHRRMCKVQLGLHVYDTCRLPGAGGT